jgi:carbonic anhydrase
MSERDKDSLFDGVRSFNQTDFVEHRELFARVARRQDPHTLFIGCSDSRVIPNLITKTLPGELFTVRNVGNLVPFYREAEEYLATTSAIEYAVRILRVKNIVICGHSNCGGVGALFADDEALSAVPHTRRWLSLARRVRDRVVAEGIDDPVEREWRAEQYNVVEQMNHLVTYPYVKDAFRRGELAIRGWYYVIETGEVFDYDPSKAEFVRIE